MPVRLTVKVPNLNIVPITVEMTAPDSYIGVDFCKFERKLLESSGIQQEIEERSMKNPKLSVITLVFNKGRQVF